MGQPADFADARAPRVARDPGLDQDRLALLEMIHGYWKSQVVRTAADLRLADHLADGPLTAQQIADRESSDPRATYRLMRACAGLGLLAYEGDECFSVTPMGALLRTGGPGTLRDTSLVFGAPSHWLPMGALPEAVRKGGTQAPSVLGAELFDYLAAHPEEAAQFSGSMGELTGSLTADAARVVDATGVRRAADVGGATGELVRELMRANPGLLGIVVDLPQAAAAARAAAEKDGLSDRFTAEPGDFFAAVPGADLYLLKAILHDWDDASCVRILGNCRDAAWPGARLVVIENVIREPGKDRFASMLDINMLAVTPGQEREIGHYDELFAASGWTRTAVHLLPGGRSLIEARLAG